MSRIGSDQAEISKQKITPKAFASRQRKQRFCSAQAEALSYLCYFLYQKVCVGEPLKANALAAHSTHSACAHPLRAGKGKALAWGRLCASQMLLRRSRGDEFFEARIIPKRIEHWIEPEQLGSERARREKATVRDRK